jgi:hypothetical protein
MSESASPASHFPDRDRLSIITAVILLAYALARFVELPVRRPLTTTLFGSSIGLEIDGQVILLLMVAALISTGSDTLIRSHPKFSASFPFAAALHWILPGVTALSLGLLLNLAPQGPAWWLGLAISALLLILVLIVEYIVVDSQDRNFRAAMFSLTALSYIVALAIFAWMRYTGTRTALSGTSTAALAALLALRLFILNGASFQRSIIFAAVVGLVCGEAMWALNYWRVTPVGAGVLLLVLFYALHGLAQQHLLGQLTRRVIIEFAVIGLIGGAVGLILALPQ